MDLVKDCLMRPLHAEEREDRFCFSERTPGRVEPDGERPDGRPPEIGDFWCANETLRVSLTSPSAHAPNIQAQTCLNSL
ncbi:hypothetical protein HAL_39640 [Haladaptatus sp. T7]|nr:hypothetical protein HAL_39640 [Haladaptatus sp. T7]